MDHNRQEVNPADHNLREVNLADHNRLEVNLADHSRHHPGGHSRPEDTRHLVHQSTRGDLCSSLLRDCQGMTCPSRVFESQEITGRTR